MFSPAARHRMLDSFVFSPSPLAAPVTAWQLPQGYFFSPPPAALRLLCGRFDVIQENALPRRSSLQLHTSHMCCCCVAVVVVVNAVVAAAGSSMVVVLALCGMAALLLLGLVVCVCRRLCCAKGERLQLNSVFFFLKMLKCALSVIIRGGK